MNKPSGAIIAGAMAAAIWGSVFVVVDVVVAVVPPFLLLTLRMLVAVTILGTVLTVRREWGIDWRARLQLMAVGAVGYGFSVGAQFLGTDYSTAVNGALITSASPAFMMLFAAPLLAERLQGRRVIALLLATLGVVLIIDPARIDLITLSFRGDALLAFASLTWGLYSVLVGLVSRRHPTMVVTVYGIIGGLVVMIPAAGIESFTRQVGRVDGWIVLGVIYLGSVAMALAMWLWNRSLAQLPAGTVALLFFAQPLTGALLAWVFLGQPMTPIMWIGALCIGVGVGLALRSPTQGQIVGE